MSRLQAILLVLFWAVLCYLVLVSAQRIDGPLILSLTISGALVFIPIYKRMKKKWHSDIQEKQPCKHGWFHIRCKVAFFLSVPLQRLHFFLKKSIKSYLLPHFTQQNGQNAIFSLILLEKCCTDKIFTISLHENRWPNRLSGGKSHPKTGA